MPTLLLRLCGPMQSWGTRSRFGDRDTELEPSKSGVIGLLCAALGVARSEPVDTADLDLASLRMGVRVDSEGRMARDYQTAGGGGSGVRRADGTLDENAIPSNRYYLEEADFLVGFEGDDRALLERLDGALRSPHWQLCLGRKSFLPGVPVWIPGGGLRDPGLEAALQAEEWPLRPCAFAEEHAKRPRLRYVLERQPGATAEVRTDQPLGAAFRERAFGPRWIETSFVAGEE